MINHSVCCILIINNLAWLFMITIVCRSFDQRPIIALVNNNLIFALTSKTNLVVSMFACFCIRFSRYGNPLRSNGLQTNVCLSTFISHQKPKLSFRSLITYESE
jgi:hypothetical protein